MAKSKNHTNHNQNRKAHRNGIKKPRKFLHESTLGPKDIMESEQLSKYTYPIQMTNLLERENWIVSTDHCYARPWNWKCNTTFLKPSKTLFISKHVDSNTFLYSVNSLVKEDEDVDIESVQEDSVLVYDVLKAKELMEECSKHVTQIRNTNDENWEENIVKINWSSSQYRLFNGFVNILNSFQLAKLAQTGMHNEAILRRTVIDKAVQRVRRLFATVSFDTKLLQWLHLLLIDNLDCENLASYLDILQTLNCKIPKFVGAILNNPSTSLRFGLLNNENIVPILKKPWDPVATSLNQDKPSKLPGSPILIVVPSSPNSSKRNKKWMALLSHLGHVVSVPLNFGASIHRMTMTNCIDQMYALTRGRIQEVRDNYPNKHIILVGIGMGAALALQLAQSENIFCVISLGFSLFTIEGKRGDPDDSLLELQCPVLFVIGECSNNSIQENMEDLRERMRVETGLIVVGSADNNLIVSKKKRREERITQSIVDRCIADEIGEFISGLILSPFPPQMRQSPTNINLDHFKSKKFTERRRYNSNTSSVDSEAAVATTPTASALLTPPPSLSQMQQAQSLTAVKIPRPVGRPPGKSKNKLDSKWVAHSNQAVSSSNSTTVSRNEGSPFATTTQSDTAAPSYSTITATHVMPTIKKIKTLQPIITTGLDGSDKTSNKNLKILPLSLNQNGGGHLIHNGIKVISSQPNNISLIPGAVKVHENIQISNQTAIKLISSTNPVDFTRLSSLPGQKNSAGNLILMPDGKIKSITSAKPVINLKSTSNNVILSVPQGSKLQSKRNKFVFPKRNPANQDISNFTTVSPPTRSLTSQEIMDLPIIFADDNKILDTSTVRQTNAASLAPSSGPLLFENPIRTQQQYQTQSGTTKFVSPITANKFVIVTKSNQLLTSVKRPLTATTISPQSGGPPAAKYPKIIFSKKVVNSRVDDETKSEQDKAISDNDISHSNE